MPKVAFAAQSGVCGSRITASERSSLRDWIGCLWGMLEMPIGEGVSELRIHYGPGYRIYFQKRGSAIVVLLCGGDKSTQAKDIRTATCLAMEWNE